MLKVKLSAYISYVDGHVLEFPDHWTEEEVSEACQEYVMERLDWGFKYIED
jgi:hypothetical protein